MKGKIKPTEINIGVVGLGLMGSSIVVSLLIAGHKVKAIAPVPEDITHGTARINNELMLCAESGLLKNAVNSYLSRLCISENYGTLSGCDIVLECVVEQLEIKKSVFKKITSMVGLDT